MKKAKHKHLPRNIRTYIVSGMDKEPKPSIYIETSVISYLAARPSRDLIVAGHQQLTAEWWSEILPYIDAFVSPLVLEEISKGDPNAAKKRLQLVENVPILEVTPETYELANRYFSAIGIPEKARADSYHLAISVINGIDYIVSWNCVHIASARVQKIMEKINRALGLENSIVCTPEELMEV